ncbi:MAG: hypothetical protein IKR58_03025 [Lachnospiraceae bacterium]|nr:hypothetical protein [Lachnospiraceae bacterium]
MRDHNTESPGKPGLSFHTKFQNLIWIVYVMLAVLLLLVIGFGVMHPDSYGELRSVWSGKKTLFMMTAGLFLSLLLIWAVSYAMARMTPKKETGILLILTGAALAAQLFLLFHYPIQIWWDNTSVLSSAISIVTGHHEWFDKDYFNQLGHQNCFLFLTVVLYKIADLLHISKNNISLYFSLIDLLALDASAVLSALTAMRIKDGRTAKRVWVFWLLWPGTYLFAGYYYTTNMSLFFLTLYLYLVSLAWEKKRSPVFYIVLGLLTGFGCQYRATMLIAVIATVCYAFFRLPKAPVRAALLTAAGAAVMILLLRFSYGKLIPEYDEQARFPVTHWLMMAAQGNGEYNDADLAFTDSFPTRAEKEKATRDEYIRRLKDLGFFGCIGLAARKTTHNWSYGNHSYYPLFHRYDRLSDLLWTPDHELSFYLQQLFHLSVFILVFAGLFARALDRWTKGGFREWLDDRCEVKHLRTELEVDYIGFLQILLVGGFLFYMLWETYPYYSVGFLPVLFILAAESLDWICDIIYALLQRFGGVYRSSNPTALFARMITAAVYFIPAGLIIAIFAGTVLPQHVIPVVTQKKFHAMYYTGGAERIEQTFVAERDFDTITFWLTKEHLDIDTGGEYEIILTGEKSGEVFREHYSTQGMTQIDEFTRTFDRVSVPRKEEFTLTFAVEDEPADNRLGIGYFDLPIEAYMYGDLKADGTVVDGDLFFTVTCGGPDGVIRLYD